MIAADVLVVGAGPSGLFQVFELGLQGLDAIVVEALPGPGGQCAELYPDKPIYDIPAIPEISGAGLTAALMRQIEPFGAQFHFGERVVALEPVGERFEARTDRGTRFDVGAVVIAAGVGVFQPVKLKLQGIERHEGGQLLYSVNDRAALKGQRLLVFGGGDSALDWAIALAGDAESLVLVHRSDRFRAQPALVSRMQALCADGRMELLLGKATGYRERGGRLLGIEVDGVDGRSHFVEAGRVLVFFGMVPNPGAMTQWGLEMEGHRIRVDTERFETSRPGIYAIGDINVYPGKQKLILSAFHEAALAAFAIKQRLEPGRKIHLQYTTTSPLLRKRLGVSDEGNPTGGND